MIRNYPFIFLEFSNWFSKYLTNSWNIIFNQFSWIKALWALHHIHVQHIETYIKVLLHTSSFKQWIPTITLLQKQTLRPRRFNNILCNLSTCKTRSRSSDDFSLFHDKNTEKRCTKFSLQTLVFHNVQCSLKGVTRIRRRYWGVPIHSYRSVDKFLQQKWT